MGLIANKEGGHDITFKGKIKSKVTQKDFSDIEGSIKTKQDGVALKANTVLKSDGQKVQIHVYSSDPLDYVLWHGSTEQDPDDEWWRREEV